MKNRSLSYLFVSIFLCSLLLSSCKSETENKAAASALPPLEITAVKLLADYEADYAAAHKIYGNRSLLISGEIMSITKNHDGSSIVLLNSPESSIGSVRCLFTADQAAAIAQLNRKDNTIVKGECNGMDDTHIQVIINNSTITSKDAITAAFNGKPKDHPNNQKAMEVIAADQKQITSFISDGGILYASVVNDGSKMDNYAKQLRSILEKHEATVKWVKIIEFDTADPSNPDNSFGKLLAETRW